ncbi:MAG: radical SAM family heme chaperone HemW [Spirochaetales bacterium]
MHIPFCRSKCGYCSFTSETSWDVERERRLIARLRGELSEHADQLGQASTAYIGGGTPSVLSHVSIAALLSGITTTSPHIREITLEANPESVTPELLAAAHAGGVTRLSVGVQSFSKNVLRAIGRKATAAHRLEAIRTRWPRALSADLIIDTPGALPGDTIATVRRAVDLGVDHLSVYSLSVEPGTALASRASNDEYVLAEAEEDAILELLAVAGFERYEVSNFARPGFECDHNVGYWRQRGYHGFGPSAVGTLYTGDEALRITKTERVDTYLSGDQTAATYERLDQFDLTVEHVMLGLRTREGVVSETMRSRYGWDLQHLAPVALAMLLEQRLLTRSRGGFAATARGWRFLDGVLRQLICEIRVNLDTLQV